MLQVLCCFSSRMKQAVDESPGNFKLFAQTFAALQHRNYRLGFAGQVVSLFGTWMQLTAQGFLIYQLTKSPVFLGFVGFASGAPSLVFMLYAGVVADRVSRRTLLLATQSAMMLLAFILTTLTFLNFIAPWHITCLHFCSARRMHLMHRHVWHSFLNWYKGTFDKCHSPECDDDEHRQQRSGLPSPVLSTQRSGQHGVLHSMEFLFSRLSEHCC